MDLPGATEYSFLAGCFQDEPKCHISWTFVLITAFRIIHIHVNQCSGDEKTAVATFGLNQTAGVTAHLVSRILYESPTYPFPNVPTQPNPLRNELSNLWHQNAFF
jgi:hypothetical protein